MAKPQTGGKQEAAETGGGMCTGQACKSSAKRFSFCDEHFEQFKFGLIKKTGQPVPDYDKKIEHYEAYKKKLVARKAA